MWRIPKSLLLDIKYIGLKNAVYLGTVCVHILSLECKTNLWKLRDLIKALKHGKSQIF